MKNFTAIHLETANENGNGICKIGVVRVENGIVSNEIGILVQPPHNFYLEKCIALHGITPEDTANAPTFDKIWHLIEPFIKNQAVVAHNSLCFDFPVLRKTLEYYKIPVPDFRFNDTLRMYRAELFAIERNYKIPAYYMEALRGAQACAELYKQFLSK